MRNIYFKTKIDQTDFEIYNYFCYYMDSERQITANNRLLEYKLGKDTRTIQRSLKRLKNAGKIDILNCGGHNRIILVMPEVKNHTFVEIPDYNWLE